MNQYAVLPNLNVRTPCQFPSLSSIYMYNDTVQRYVSEQQVDGYPSGVFYCEGNSDPSMCYLSARMPMEENPGLYSVRPIYQARCAGACSAEPPVSGWAPVGPSCATDNITVDKIFTMGCGNHGTCGDYQICTCDNGWQTPELGSSAAIGSTDQCSEGIQCGAPKTLTSLRGTETVKRSKGPLGWTGDCVWNFDVRDNGNTSVHTDIEVGSLALATPGKFIVTYGTGASKYEITTAITPADEPVIVQIPSGLFTVRFEIGNPDRNWEAIFAWNASLPDKEPGTAVEERHSRANGRVRLTGSIEYDKVYDPGSRNHQEFVHEFESDVEAWERKNGRIVSCSVTQLQNGSVIVDFALTVIQGSPNAAAEALLAMQAGIINGTLSRLAGSPLDRNTPVITAGPQGCPLCPSCPTTAPTPPPTDSPTNAPCPSTSTSSGLDGAQLAFGAFVGISALLACGFLLFGVRYLMAQAQPVDLDETAREPARTSHRAKADPGAAGAYGHLGVDEDEDTVRNPIGSAKALHDNL